METFRELTSQDGHNAIALRQQLGNSPQSLPAILFLSGFRSDMTGSKAEHLAKICAESGRAFTRMDYRGHGASGGHYTDFIISDWLADVLTVIDTLPPQPLILVGSSLGGWLSLLAAAQRPERVVGLVGIAAAPDFPTQLILKHMTPAQHEAYARDHIIIDNESDWLEPSRFTRRFMEDSVQHNVFDHPYRFNGSIHLLQGKKDTAVPWQIAQKLQAHIEAPKVTLTLIKDGDHRLSTPENLSLLGNTVMGLTLAEEG